MRRSLVLAPALLAAALVGMAAPALGQQEAAGPTDLWNRFPVTESSGAPAPIPDTPVAPEPTAPPSPAGGDGSGGMDGIGLAALAGGLVLLLGAAAFPVVRRRRRARALPAIGAGGAGQAGSPHALEPSLANLAKEAARTRRGELNGHDPHPAESALARGQVPPPRARAGEPLAIPRRAGRPDADERSSRYRAFFVDSDQLPAPQPAARLPWGEDEQGEGELTEAMPVPETMPMPAVAEDVASGPAPTDDAPDPEVSEGSSPRRGGAKRRFADHEIAGALRQGFRECGAPFTAGAYRAWRVRTLAGHAAEGPGRIPSYETVVARLGGWKAAVEVARQGAPAPDDADR